MATSREEFRRKAAEKARLALREKRVREGEVVGIANSAAEQSNVEGKLPSGVLKVTEEERKVLNAYHKWKESKRVREEGEESEGSEEAAPMAETKNQRIQRLKRKIERRRRVESLKAKLAEKRNSQRPDTVRDQAKALKERISNVRAKLRKINEEGEMLGAPMAPPAGAATQPAMPGMANPMDGMSPNLPPEITAEIQNIATAAQSLAQMAGVAPAPGMGADPSADIPAETPAAAGSGMMTEKAQRIARIKSLLEKKKLKEAEEKEEEKDEGKEADKMITEARNRAAARREALKKIRARTMSEASYDAENAATTDVQGFVKTALDTAGAMGGAAQGAYGMADKGTVIQQAGVKHSGPDASMPGNSGATSSIKAAGAWKPRALNYGGKMPDHLPKSLPESVESTEGGWDTKHIDHYIERRELNFKKLLESGSLG